MYKIIYFTRILTFIKGTYSQHIFLLTLGLTDSHYERLCLWYFGELRIQIYSYLRLLKHNTAEFNNE